MGNAIAKVRSFENVDYLISAFSDEPAEATLARAEAFYATPMREVVNMRIGNNKPKKYCVVCEGISFSDSDVCSEECSDLRNAYDHDAYKAELLNERSFEDTNSYY